MATISALCRRRSTSETTQAALGNTSRHSANGAICGDQRAFVLIAARDQFEHQIGVTVGVGEVADLIDRRADVGRA